MRSFLTIQYCSRRGLEFGKMDTRSESIGYPFVKSVGFRIRIDPELRQDFIRACKAEDLSAAHVLRVFMRSYVDRSIAARQLDLFDQQEPEP